MQALRAAEDGSKSLNCHTHNVILWLLGSEADSSRLRMEATQPRARILCLECFSHLACPNATRSTILGDLFKEVVVSVEEKGKTRRKLVHIHAASNAPAHIFKSVPKCER